MGFGYKYTNHEKYNNDDKYNEFLSLIDYIDAIQTEYSLKSQYENMQSEKIMKNIIEDLKYSSVKNTGWFEKIEQQTKKNEIYKTALIDDEV